MPTSAWMLEHPGDEIAHVLFHLRIGQMVGERAVRFAVELGHRTAEPAQQFGGEPAGDPVAGVHHHRERARERHPGRDRAEILLARIAPRARAGAAREVTSADGREEPLDLVLGEGRGSRVNHLHAIVRHRVVAAGDGRAAVEIPVRGGEVEERRVIDADVDHVHSRRQDAGGEGLLEGGRGRPVVHADGHGAPASPSDEGAVGAADQLERLRRDVDADLAPHIVGPEDERVQLHVGRSGARAQTTAIASTSISQSG